MKAGACCNDSMPHQVTSHIYTTGRARIFPKIPMKARKYARKNEEDQPQYNPNNKQSRKDINSAFFFSKR